MNAKAITTGVYILENFEMNLSVFAFDSVALSTNSTIFDTVLSLSVFQP